MQEVGESIPKKIKCKEGKFIVWKWSSTCEEEKQRTRMKNNYINDTWFQKNREIKVFIPLESQKQRENNRMEKTVKLYRGEKYWPNLEKKQIRVH